METPNSVGQLKTVRSYTPRLSERKKKLFASGKREEELENDLLNGIEPLGDSNEENIDLEALRSRRCAELVNSKRGSLRAESSVFFSGDSDSEERLQSKPSPLRRSVRLHKKGNASDGGKSNSDWLSSPRQGKENIPLQTPIKETEPEEQLQKLFSVSMCITPRGKSQVIEETSSEGEEDASDGRLGGEDQETRGNPKRHYDRAVATGLSPQRKVAKADCSSPLESLSIPTKCFYSAAKTPSPPNATKAWSGSLARSPSSSGGYTFPRTRHKERHSVGAQATRINKGVRHKIRRRSHAVGLASRPSTHVDIDHILRNIRNERLRSLIAAKREERAQIEKLHSIFRNSRDPIAMARPLSALSNEGSSNDNNNNEHKDKEQQQGAYEYAEADKDFSDIEDEGSEATEEEEEEEEEDIGATAKSLIGNEEVIPFVSYSPDDGVSGSGDNPEARTADKRKFFKSGLTTRPRKEVQIAHNIKATVTANGKLEIVPEKKRVRKRAKIRKTGGSDFSNEQATVDAILRNLDDTAFGDMVVSDETVQRFAVGDTLNEQEQLNELSLPANDDYAEFRKRLPHNTSDPEIIEQQHLLLDFLINNNICTEENFVIFIADPENHKDEAARIVDEVVVVVKEQNEAEFRQRIPYNTSDPDAIALQHRFLDFLIEHNICTEENFDIFIANYAERSCEAEAIIGQVQKQKNQQRDDIPKMGTEAPDKHDSGDTSVSGAVCTRAKDADTTELPLQEQEPQEQQNENTVSSSWSPGGEKLFPIFYSGRCQPLPQISKRRKQRSWKGGFGVDQYQIDAGQKRFGAHQCKQCGLVYTLHEPEEEKLHRDFHASLHVLRFKGWIDEDIVAIHTEWGADGRILRLTESSPMKRRERLMDILKIVDTELGFSSYIIPKTFVAYFAVRKLQIVGLCLVQPLEKASKYVCVDGIDCCTEEQFEAKCGISRIWVSPLHRRLHIASKLVQAVQQNTIFGEEIPPDKIAFSAPTEDGRRFAQKITNTENFLVYQ